MFTHEIHWWSALSPTSGRLAARGPGLRQRPRRARRAAPPIRRWIALLILTFSTPLWSAQDQTQEDHCAEFKTIEADFARFDDLLSRYNEPVTRVNVLAYRNLAKSRAESLRENFDQSKYDELRYDINLHCQRMANWLAPLTTPPRPAPGEETLEFALAELDPSPGNPAEVKAALAVVDHEITRLEKRARDLPGGAAARAAEQARIKRVKDRRAALEKNFTKAQWAAVVTDLSEPQ